MTVEYKIETLPSCNPETSAAKEKVLIPRAMAVRIEARLLKSDFKSVDEYVSYVIEQVLIDVENEDSVAPDTLFSKEDQENVKQRLRDLGYL